MSAHPTRRPVAGRWTVELTAPDGAGSRTELQELGDDPEEVLRRQWPLMLDLLLDAQHKFRAKEGVEYP